MKYLYLHNEINFLSSQRAGKSSHHLTTLLGKYIFRQEKVAGLKISEPLLIPLKTYEGEKVLRKMWNICMTYQHCQLHHAATRNRQVHSVFRPVWVHSGGGSIPPELCVTVQKPDIFCARQEKQTSTYFWTHCAVREKYWSKTSGVIWVMTTIIQWLHLKWVA